jgi:hypothetical protein
MKELDSKAWRAFHKIGTSLLPHLGRQITNHSGISGAEYVVLVALSELTVMETSKQRESSAFLDFLTKPVSSILEI